GTKAKLTIEPKCSRLDTFFILVTDLIGIECEDRYAQQVPENMKRVGIQPGSLTIAEGVIEVEAAFHPLADRETFKVPDGHTVLEDHRRMIGTQRQSFTRRHSH